MNRNTPKTVLYYTIGGVIYTEKLDNIYVYLQERLHNHCMTHIY